jgi:hypothetical protein
LSNPGDYWTNTQNGPSVTLEHGTSEGLLASILRNGFQPFTADVEQHTRTILSNLLPGRLITDDIVEQSIRVAGGRGHRDEQSNRGQQLFACLGPNSTTAQLYATLNAQNGGEYATTLYNVVSGNRAEDPRLQGAKPLFDGARPVIIAFAVPRSEIRDQLPDPAASGGAFPHIANQEITIRDTSAIEIKAVTFAAKGADGKWTFEGQPALSPALALGEIADAFKAERSVFKTRFGSSSPAEIEAAAPLAVDPKIAKLAADVEKWVGKSMVNIQPYEKALALVSLQSQHFIDGLIAPGSIATEAASVARNLEVLVRENPEAAASMCCSLMNHPKLGALGSIAATTYGNSMHAIAKTNPQQAHKLAGIHMEVYGHKPTIAKAAKVFEGPKAVSLARPARKGSFSL